MTVARILASKGRDVATIEPTRTLLEAARMLSERRIGSLVVTSTYQSIHCIQSEHDNVKII